MPWDSLVPRPPPFLFFSLHGSGRASEKQGSPGNTCHMVRWTRGGHREEGPIVKYVRTKIEKRVSYPWRQVVSTTLRSEVQNCSWSWTLERMILCIDFAIGPLLSTFTSRPPDIIRDEWAQAFPFFALFCFRVSYWTQSEEQKRGSLGMRLLQDYFGDHFWTTTSLWHLHSTSLYYNW